MSDRLAAGASENTRDFLLELRSEEIPARMQAGARTDLERLFRKAMDDAGVTLGEITVWSTPRRLALIARDLPQATAAVSEELKGPRVGAPPQALEGFLRKTGLAETDLVERDGVLFAVIDKPGRATAAVLAEAIPALIRAFPWPKSQRWGAASISTESLRWVRPLSAIVALLGRDVVPFEIDGIAAGRLTRGHRFHSHGEIEIADAEDYSAKLRAAHVIVNHQTREALIREQAKAAAAAAGLTLVEDEGLVIENAGLTERPVPLLGRFDEAYLDVPPEVIQLTARTNQKYFVCESPSRLREGLGEGVLPTSSQTSPPPTPPASGRGELANAFVCTANIVASDGGAEIVAGNRKVLAARLSDARFFWEQDRKVPLAEQAKKLSRITFHEKLGTVADKVERVAKLARWLVEEGVVPAQAGTGGSQAQGGQRSRGEPGTTELADQAELAARLCKADLVTEMVGEFPELQGLMGGYYARAEGLPDAVADAIRDHYKPVGQGDDVPTAPVTVAVSLADKLDTLVGFFWRQLPPSGSKDPFALRRAAISVIRTIVDNGIRCDLRKVIFEAFKILVAKDLSGEKWDVWYTYLVAEHVTADDPDFAQKILDLRMSEPELNKHFYGPWSEVWPQLSDFLADRLKVQQREAGVRHDLIDAVFALGGEDDLVRLLARVHALQAFVGTEDGKNLLAGYKRAANLLKAAEKDGESFEQVSDAATRLPEERALAIALKDAEIAAAEAVKNERFEEAMFELSKLREPIDAFFVAVMINVDDDEIRRQRLQLLAKFRASVHLVADFSRIEG